MKTTINGIEEPILDRAINGEVVQIFYKGVKLYIASYQGFIEGQKRVVESALILGEEMEKLKARVE